MKKAFLILLLFYASLLNAQVTKIHGFAGKDKRVANVGVYERKTTLGYPGDVESRFYWEYLEGPDGAKEPTISNLECHKPNPEVNFGLYGVKDGLYKFQVTRMSDYGIQVETVNVVLTHYIDVLSIECKPRCLTEDAKLKIYDFTFNTDPQINVEEIPRFFELYPKVDYYEIDVVSLLQLSKDVIGFSQVGYTLRNTPLGSEYEFFPIEKTATVYSADPMYEGSLDIFNGKDFVKFCEERLKGLSGILTDKINKREVNNVVEAVDGAEKLNKKAQPYMDKIPLERTVEVEFKVSGGIAASFSCMCYEDTPTLKMTLSPNIGLNFGISVDIPTTLSLGGLARVNFVAAGSASFEINGIFDFYFPLTGEELDKGSSQSVECGLLLKGELGGRVIVVDKKFAYGDVVVSPQANIKGVLTKEDGLHWKKDWFHLDLVVKLYCAGLNAMSFPFHLY